MYFEHTCHSPDIAWSLCHTTIRDILRQVNAEMWGIEDLTAETITVRAKKIEILWAELIGRIYAISYYMNAHGYTEDANRFVDLLNIVVNADIKDQAVQDELLAYVSGNMINIH